jgi:hypothetical protein
MKTLLRRVLGLGGATLVAALCALGQNHYWAGRTLNDFEWSIHETLGTVPSYGVFDTINFEVQNKTVTLSGEVVGERVKHRAEKAVSHVQGVEKIVNKIEVLPTSRRDDALRVNVYRALYKTQAEQSAPSAGLPVHIIVKNGWVTLEGVVDSEEERGRYHLMVLQVTPYVSDNLRVASESKTMLSGSGE